MSFIEKITDEGIFDYLLRRLTFLLSIIVLVITVSFLMFGRFVSGKNIVITVLLTVIAFANFMVALVSFLRYSKLKGDKNIKYTKLGIKVAKAIVDIVSFALTVSLLMGSESSGVLMQIGMIFLVIFYSISLLIKVGIVAVSLFFTYKARKKM